MNILKSSFLKTHINVTLPMFVTRQGQRQHIKPQGCDHLSWMTMEYAYIVYEYLKFNVLLILHYH